MQFTEIIASKFFLVFVSLLLLYFALKKILFVPVTEFIEKRQNSIKESIENAQNKNVEAEALINQYKEKLHSADDEVSEIINRARVKANIDYSEIIKNAHAEAEKIRENALENIKHEKELMILEAKNYIAELSIKAAGKLISINLDSEKNKQLVNNFINEEGVI